jgi:hypothetical protein
MLPLFAAGSAIGAEGSSMRYAPSASQGAPFPTKGRQNPFLMLKAANNAFRQIYVGGYNPNPLSARRSGVCFQDFIVSASRLEIARA